jgi:hypothetical protein
VAVLLFGVVFLLPTEVARGWVYTASFGVAACAALALVLGAVRGRGERLTLAPTTARGRLALVLLLLGALPVMLPGALQALFPAPGPWAMALVLAGFLCEVAAAATALVAVLRQRERSLLVIVPPLLAGAFVIYFVLGELVLPH